MDKDSKIYKDVKREADAKFEEKTSAYKSSWISREYKKRGGKIDKSKQDTRLNDWFEKEKWLDAEQYVKGIRKPCGFGQVDLCRPINRPKNSSKNFITLKDLDKKDVEMAKKLKKQGKRIDWNKIVNE